MMPPMAAVAAMADPVIAAKNMQARILTIARPLGKCPSRVSAKSTIRLLMPPWNISSPASMKRGIAISAIESAPVNIRCTTTSGGKPFKRTPPSETKPREKQIGTPIRKIAKSQRIIPIA